MNENLFENLKTARRSIEPKEFRQLHREAVFAVQELKSKEALLIKALQTIDENLIYRYLGCNSLFRYCLDYLKLTEGQAVMYISVARKSRELPALQKALDAGEVTVSKVSRITSVINNVNQTYWLDLAQSSNKREIEKEVAKVNPRLVMPEKARYLTDSIVELQVPVSEEIFKILKRAQERLSQKRSQAVSLEQTIEVLAKAYLRTEDPLEREARRENKRKISKSEKADAHLSVSDVLPCPGQVNSQANKTQRLKQTLVDKVLTRDKHQCTFEQCPETKWLQVHHVIPKQNGGSNDITNLRTLCFGHHREVHGH